MACRSCIEVWSWSGSECDRVNLEDERIILVPESGRDKATEWTT